MSEMTTSPDGELDEGYYPELDELPPRPRRKLVTPVSAILLLVLFAAGGFIGGVEVQKGQGSSSGGSLASSFASRFGAAAGGATSTAGSTSAGSTSRLRGLFGGGGAAGAGATIGTVSSINGRTLYVSEVSGDTVAVVTTPESKITKSESVGAKAIHPGDSVVVEGLAGSKGTITASSVTDSGSSSTGTSGGLASLFGGSSTSSSSSSGVSSLFGK
jgi:hypothetical protein